MHVNLIFMLKLTQLRYSNLTQTTGTGFYLFYLRTRKLGQCILVFMVKV